MEPITTDSEELLLRLFGGCQCSDDLAVVCEAHASLSWYALRLLEGGSPEISARFQAAKVRRVRLPLEPKPRFDTIYDRGLANLEEADRADAEMALGPTISGPTERAGCDPSVAEPTDSV